MINTLLFMYTCIVTQVSSIPVSYSFIMATTVVVLCTCTVQLLKDRSIISVFVPFYKKNHTNFTKLSVICDSLVSRYWYDFNFKKQKNSLSNLFQILAGLPTF